MNFRRFRKSVIYNILIGFLLIKMVFIGMLFNMDGSGKIIPVVKTNKVMAEEPGGASPALKNEQPAPLKNQIKTEKKLFVDDETSYLESEVLRRQKKELERERQRVNQERRQLEVLKKEIDIKIARLSEIQDTVQQKIDEQKALIKKHNELQQEALDKKFKHLLKIYSSMPAKKSAALIDKLDMDVVVRLLSKMKGENVGQILGYVSPEKAARISERLAKNNE
ncbi:flagellar protein FlbB [Candidatus Magnetomoraceae bacterium gMMP-1]